MYRRESEIMTDSTELFPPLSFDPKAGDAVCWMESNATVVEVRGCSTFLISTQDGERVVDYVELSRPLEEAPPMSRLRCFFCRTVFGAGLLSSLRELFGVPNCPNCGANRWTRPFLRPD